MFLSLLLGVTLHGALSYAEEMTPNLDHQVIATDGTELALVRYPAKGEYLIVWIAPGYGLQDRSLEVARKLSTQGIEIWQIDLAEALFLPRSTEQMRAFTGQYVADLIESAYRETGKKIVLLSRSYGAIPILRGARVWQSRKPDKPYLLGALLFSPDLYTTIPSLGLNPEYVPVTAATNIPIKIFQDGKRGNRWYIDNLITTLESGGSRPQLTLLPGVSALFFTEDDAPDTLRAIAALPSDIVESIKMLEKTPIPLAPAALKKHFKSVGSGIDDHLKKFKAGFLPPAIDLMDATGKQYRRQHYKNQVTVVNFWATWCPPCVEEIPSLNRLREEMRDTPFELVSINYAEGGEKIKEFLEKVNVEFPVLLDETGQVSVSWRVIAFPSTYVIGPDGTIRYGVNAAIQWDSPEVISTLKALGRNTP